MKKITILIPAYNEEAVLDIMYSRLSSVLDAIDGYDFEMLFINDGSREGTLSTIKRLRSADTRISYLGLSRNFGKEIA